MRIALAQINPLVGDLSGNAKRLLEACLKISHQTQGTPPALVVSPELSLWGYPPRDLLLSPEHLEQQSEALTQLQQGLRHALPQTALLVGMVEPATDQQQHVKSRRGVGVWTPLCTGHGHIQRGAVHILCSRKEASQVRRTALPCDAGALLRPHRVNQPPHERIRKRGVEMRGVEHEELRVL